MASGVTGRVVVTFTLFLLNGGRAASGGIGMTLPMETFIFY